MHGYQMMKAVIDDRQDHHDSSDVVASSITVGANDVPNGGGSHDIAISGNRIVNNQFVPSASRVVVTGVGTDAVINMNGSELYSPEPRQLAAVLCFGKYRYG